MPIESARTTLRTGPGMRARMQSTDYPPEGSGSAKRRPLFGRSSSDTEDRIEQALAEYREVLEQRLDEGLLALQSSAATLMQEIAAEMWRQGGADVSDPQQRILEFVSRDQAVRGLIATSDERFQQLSMRTERLEGELRRVADENGELRDLLAEGARSLSTIAQAPAIVGAEDLRDRLTQVEAHISTTMQYIQERDRALMESIGSQVREHGELVTSETRRVVEGMQGYVTEGVESIGRLAQRVEGHMERVTARDDQLADRISMQLSGTLGEQIGMIYERLGMEARTLSDALASHQHWVGQLLDTRVMGLAQLVRSDSEKLRDRLVESAAAQDEHMGRLLDERLARVQQAVDTAVVDLRGAINGQLSTVGQQAAEAVDTAIAGRMDATTERMAESADSIDRARTAFERMQGEADESIARTIDQRIGALAKMIRSDNQAIAIRLAEVSEHQQREVESDHPRQTLRAVKELQATMAGEMMGVLERQFGILAEQLHRETQTIAESLVRSNDVLARRVDAVAAKVQKDSGRDMDTVQTAIERMGEAMHALASIGRQTAGGAAVGGLAGDPRGDQIELP